MATYLAVFQRKALDTLTDVEFASRKAFAGSDDVEITLTLLVDRAHLDVPLRCRHHRIISETEASSATNLISLAWAHCELALEAIRSQARTTWGHR